MKLSLFGRQKQIKNTGLACPVKNRLFGDVNEEMRRDTIEEIMDSSCPSKSFFVMMTVSAILCTIGIMGNNASVIIGGMLVAPMLSPILAISMGIGMADFRLIFRSVKIVLQAIAYAMLLSFIVAMMLKKPDIDSMNHEMILRTIISVESLLVALVAGVAATLSLIRPELHKFLTGTAIAVALIPPLSMSAIGLRMMEFGIFYSAFMQFIFNIVGIILASLLIFSLSKFYVSKKVVEEELREEDEMLGRKRKEESKVEFEVKEIKKD